jgi:transcriptional regulator with XRE-family HTH domain
MGAEDVGERIRQARAGLGLTQDKFARQLGVTRISVARYEAGRVPNLGLLQQIAQLAGVTVGWLVGGVTDETPPLTDRSVSLELAEAHKRLLAFLKQEAAKIAPLPKPLRRNYEVRLDQSIARLEQELEEYRQLLESRTQAAGSGRKRRAKKGRPP